MYDDCDDLYFGVVMLPAFCAAVAWAAWMIT
jgi:hypothetical protein